MESHIEVLLRSVCVDLHGLFEPLSCVHSEPAQLNSAEHFEKLISCDVKTEHLIVEREHGEEMLVLDVSRKPSGSEARHVDERKIDLRKGVAHEISNQVA